MSEVLCGLILVVISWFVGLMMGMAKGKHATKEWLEKKGCYLCNEKYNNIFDGLQ